MKSVDIEKVIKILKQETRGYEIPIVQASRKKFHSPFHILVTVMLTAQTKDALVASMMPEIFSRIKKPEDILKIPLKDLEKLLYPISFYRTKARNLKKMAKILIEEYGGKIPTTQAKMIELPGVGEKTANIVLNRVYKSNEGIGVDVHVHRISNRLGYIRTKTPHETEMRLQKKLPKKYWNDYNPLLVKWGQNICTPISPWCSKCVLRDQCNRIGVGRRR